MRFLKSRHWGLAAGIIAWMSGMTTGVLAEEIKWIDPAAVPQTLAGVEILRDSIADGAMVVVGRISKMEEIAPFLELWDEKSIPVGVVELDAPDKANLRNSEGWNLDSLLLWPTDVRPVLQSQVKRFFTFKGGEAEKYWAWPAIVNGNKFGARPVIMTKAAGKGQLVLSTLDLKNCAEIRGNLESALTCCQLGFLFKNVTCENFGQGKTRGLFRGHGAITVDLKGIAPTNIVLASRLEVENLDGDGGTRTYEGAWTYVGPNKSGGARIEGIFNFHGHIKAKLFVRNLETGGEVLLKEYDETFPGYLEVKGPAYRGMVSAARREKDVRVSVRINAFDENLAGREVTVAAFAPGTSESGSPLVEEKVTLADPSERYLWLRIPDDAACGVYSLVAKTVDDRGCGHVARGNFKIVPVRKDQVFVDQDGALLSAGEPWYPFGIYHVANSNDFQRCKEIGFDLVQFWTTLMTPELLEKLQGYGMKICCESSGWGEIINNWRGTPPPVYNFETNADFRALAELSRSREGVLAFWYTADEPGFDVLSGVKRLKDYWERFDPEDHPSYVVSTGDPRISAMADIIGLDVYVRYGLQGHSSFERIADRVDEAYRLNRPGQCVIMVPQCFGNPELHCEKPEEVTAMAYTAVVHGVKGLFWYCWWDGNRQGICHWPETAAKVKQVIAEVRPLSGALLSGSFVKARSEDGRMHAAFCGTAETGKYLIAVNTADVPSDSEIKLPILTGRRLVPLYDSPAAAIDDAGRMKLKLGVCGRAVWKIE